MALELWNLTFLFLLQLNRSWGPTSENTQANCVSKLLLNQDHILGPTSSYACWISSTILEIVNIRKYITLHLILKMMLGFGEGVFNCKFILAVSQSVELFAASCCSQSPVWLSWSKNCRWEFHMSEAERLEGKLKF